MITDIQVHTWVTEPDAPTPPMPHRPDGYPIDKLVSDMDSVGVDRAVIVPPTLFSLRADEYALEAARRHPGRFRIFEQFDVTVEGAKERLRLMNQPPYAGVRLLLHYHPEWLDGDMLNWFWSECEERGIPVAVYGGQQMALLPPVIERHPGLKVLVDHLGIVARASGPAAFETIDAVVALSRFPGVSVKVTSVPNKSAEAYPYRDIYPFIRRMYDAFGPRRLLWGSDVSQMQEGDYQRALDHVREALDFLSDADRELILGKNAAELLNWPEEASGG